MFIFFTECGKYLLTDMVVVAVPALGSFASLIQTLDQDSNDVGRLQGKHIFQYIKLCVAFVQPNCRITLL